MLSKILSGIVIVVLGLVVVASVLSYYRLATAPAGPGGVAPGGIAGHPPVPAPVPGPGSGISSGSEEPLPPQAIPAQPAIGGEERRSSILELALTSLPGWAGKIVAHDANWATATVRATSPDRKVSLDIRVVWDSELGDYEVVSAVPALGSRPASNPAAAVPEGIAQAIAARPTFAALPDRKLIPKQIADNAAVIVVQGGGAAWKVALQRRDGQWVITDARKLQPIP